MIVIVQLVLVLFASSTSVCDRAPDIDNSVCVMRDEEFLTCGSACPITCDNMKENRVCTDQCIEGCFCRKGSVRDEETNRCVLPFECPNVCPENEAFRACGTACPLTCDNVRNPPKICTLQCVSGCFCKAGLVRDSLTGKCVSPEKCSGPSPVRCFENEIFMECNDKQRCERKCNGRRKCRHKSDCFNNCLCKTGFYRDPKTLQCVMRSKCY